MPLRTYLTKHGQQEELTEKNIGKITQLVIAIQEEDANSLNRVPNVMVARIGSPKQIARVMAALTECDEVGVLTRHQSRLAEALVGDSEQQIEDLTAAPEDMNPREAIKAINRETERMFETVAELDLEQIASIRMRSALNQSMSFLAEAVPLLTDAQKICILCNRIDLALSDGEAEPEEQVLITKIQDAFGISDERFKPFFDVLMAKCDMTVLVNGNHPANALGHVVKISGLN